MLKTATLGFPRIGLNRELKKAVESYWKQNSTLQDLKNTASQIKEKNWQSQKDSQITYIPSNDFSFYDQIVDNIALFGAVPARFNHKFGSNIELDTIFAMSRGVQKNGVDITAMEMTKWFDTNYHYIVAELEENQQFTLSTTKIFDDFLEAKKIGIHTRPVILGPITFLMLAKTNSDFNRFDLLSNLLLAYQQLFIKLQEIGVTDLQIDEPFLVTDLNSDAINAYLNSYPQIRKFAGKIKLHLATYFEGLNENTALAFDLETDSVHIDLVRAPDQLDNCLNLIKDHQIISLGVVDGRNIWINNIENSISIVKKAIAKLGKERVVVAPSCQLLHVPVDLSVEHNLSGEIKSWLAFAMQKIEEITAIATLADDSTATDNNAKAILLKNQQSFELRKKSPLIHNQAVKERVANISDSTTKRNSNFTERKKVQLNHIQLPILPTTTIGSFPQTKEVRKFRADYKIGKISNDEYQAFIEQEIVKTVRFQEEIDLDVLVHGEFERNDMVEYFGEQLAGFCFTQNGWVQSYGSRCVKPPVIYGDVHRPKQMTVKWAKFAQGLTKKIMKGMLTGPITILQWSFVRDDQARKDTAMQIAFAIRDEVKDLEDAGIKIIQIDEAALREGLPIRNAQKKDYLKWAVDAFKISSAIVNDATQIHTHMCYSEFNDIIDAIAEMDADVISIETSRSRMELLNAFINFKYPNEIGPGVYDIHSPRVPTQQEVEQLLDKALSVLNVEQVWVNPDCGLKTRDWPETKTALQIMVNATKQLRAKIQ